MTDNTRAHSSPFWEPVSWACGLGLGLFSTLLLVLAGSPLPYLLANLVLAVAAALWSARHYHAKPAGKPDEQEQTPSWSAAGLNHSIIGLEQVCEKPCPSGRNRLKTLASKPKGP